MVMTRIGGQDYPMHSAPGCYTCQSPHRLFIENELIQGHSYAAIADAVAQMEMGSRPHPSAKGIGDHFRNNHLPLAAGAQRRLIERRAIEVGASYEEGVEDIVDLVTVNRMIVSNGFARMQSGEIKADLNDVLAASKMLYQIEQSAVGGTDEAMWREALMVYLEMAQRFIPQNLWQEYGRAVNDHPVIKAIAEAEEARRRGEALAG